MTENKRTGKKFNLKLPLETANLELIRDFVSRIAQNMGFSDENIHRIELAVDEASTNVIKHAYKYSPDNDIRILTRLENSKFIISITDSGHNFNPQLVPEPDLKKYIQQHKVGGLGMYLMKKLMDEVKYNTLSGNQNQVVLVKYLT